MDKEKIIEGYILTDLASGNFQDFITKIKMMNIDPEELKKMQLFGDPQVATFLGDLMTNVAAGSPYDASVTKLFDYVKSITKTNFSVDDIAPESFEANSAEKISEKKNDESELTMIAMNQRIDQLSDTITRMSDIVETLADGYNKFVGHDEDISDKVDAIQGNIGKMTWVLGKVIESTGAPVNMSEEFDDEFCDGGMPAGTGLADINPDAPCPECAKEAVSKEDLEEAEAYKEGIKDGMEAALNASEYIDGLSDKELSEFSYLLDDEQFSEDEEFSMDNLKDELSKFSEDELESLFNEFSDEELEQLNQLFSDEDFEEGEKSKAWYDGYNTAEKDEYKGENPVRPEELADKFGYKEGTPEYGEFIEGYKDAVDKESESKPEDKPEEATDDKPADTEEKNESEGDEESDDVEPKEPIDKVEEEEMPKDIEKKDEEIKSDDEKKDEGKKSEDPDKPNDAQEVNNCNYSFSFGDTDPKDRYNSLKEYFSKND